jgi:hypothetical protein
MAPRPLILPNSLITEPGQTWNMTGTASYSFLNFSVDIVLTTEVGRTLHGQETTLVRLEANGSSFGQTARVIEEIEVSLTSEALLLHSRVGRVFFNGELDDEDVDTYLAPAAILPRLITVGERYPFLSQLDSGDFDDAVLVESIETIDTGLGPVETIKLVAFSDDDVPVVLWLGRGVGYMKTQVNTDVDETPLIVQATLTSTDAPWSPGSIETIWSETVSFDDGWRYADWFGYFWTQNADSPWINHLGFSWAYCLGNTGNLWIYLPGNGGWLWTNKAVYPSLYNTVNGHYVYYVLFPGSTWFWDYSLGDWVDLGS